MYLQYIMRFSQSQTKKSVPNLYHLIQSAFPKHTTEHRKGQHFLSEERHEIEVRSKDGWSISRIANHLGRPYNTIKNEIKRGTVLTLVERMMRMCIWGKARNHIAEAINENYYA